MFVHDWQNQPIHSWQLEKDRRLVVWYSPERAERDRRMRTKRIEKLEKQLNRTKSPKQWLLKQGHAARFLAIEGQATVVLNEEAIADAARWDGLSGVETNLSWQPSAIREKYRHLWQVENSFRVEKHILEVPPMFHWTSERIRAHMAICYMAFACLRHVEYRLRIKGLKLSPKRILAGINSLTDQIFCDPANQHVAIASNPNSDGVQIVAALKLGRKRTPRLLN